MDSNKSQPTNKAIPGQELDNLIAAYQLASFIVAKINFMKIDYIKILDGFNRLEEAFGPLPVFHIPEYIPENHKKEILTHRLKEYQFSFSDIMEMTRGMFTISEAENIIQKIIKVLFKLPMNKLIDCYLKYYEIIFENFIVPVVNSVAPPPPKYRFQHTYDYQINWVRSYLDQHNLSDSLDFFLMNLDGTLRNALVHQNYYIKDNILVYFKDNPKKKRAIFYCKPIQEFQEEVISTLALRMIFFVICGLRLLKLEPKTLKEKLSKERKVSND